MSRNLALVLIGLLGSLVAPASAYAQLTPPAGSAGAGNSAISGVPPIPACSATPAASATRRGSRRLVRNSPPPPVVYGSVGSPPSRVVAPYAGASQRIFSADQVDSRRPPVRRRGRPQVRKFTRICRAVSASRTDARFWRTSRRDPGRGLSVKVSFRLCHRN